MTIIALKPDIGKKNFAVYCIDCGEEFSYQRRKLGYKTCLDCGEDKKIFPTAPAFNKGAYTIVTANNVKDIGK
jgi:predicted  nucleic acid-binding Zn-ribbon protein